MALKGSCAELLGYDPDPGTVRLAQSLHITDHASIHLEEILPDRDLVVLAAPVRQILHLLRDLGQHHPGQAVVLDIGSTKRQVLAAMQALPSRFDPLGGHPICGKAISTLVNAEPNLYQGAPFVLCRMPRTSPRAEQLVGSLIHVIGAVPMWMEAAEHDRWIAFTSHLPYLLSSALVQATPLSAAPLVGPGYRGSTRLAESYTSMLLDILATNRDMILPALDAFSQSLDQLEGYLRAEDWPHMEASLQETAGRHAELVRERSDGLQVHGNVK